jgi:G:T/U-mismatch repair DNA glycosylase
MKMFNKVVSGLLVTVAVGSSVVGAHEMKDDQRQKLDTAEHRQVLNLIETGNYDGWKKLMSENGHDKVLGKITAEQFAKMTALAQAMKVGDKDKIKELHKDMPKPPFKKIPKLIKRAEHFEDIQKLPEAVREQLKKAHEDGDRKEVKKILKENDIKPLHFKGKKHHSEEDRKDEKNDNK